MHQAVVAVIEQINHFRLVIIAIGLIIVGLTGITTRLATLRLLGVIVLVAGMALGLYLRFS